MDDASVSGDGSLGALASEITRDALAMADEEAASRARALYRTGIPVMEPDVVLASHLIPGEAPFDYREQTMLNAIDGGSPNAPKTAGLLYVTDRRIIHVGDRTTFISLVDITELTVTDSALLIKLADSSGVVVELPQPLRLRVLIAAAKAAARDQTSEESDSV